jgi:hypothetical protein
MSCPYTVENTKDTDYFANVKVLIKRDGAILTSLRLPEKEIANLQSIINNVYTEAIKGIKLPQAKPIAPEKPVIMDSVNDGRI